MSIDSVRQFFAARAPDITVMEAVESTATVALAAAAFGVAPGQIAKTLSLRVGETVFLLVTGGMARLNNGKAKAAFGGKARMLGSHEVEALTGHPVGGVCPFGLTSPLPIYCDISLKLFDEVLPAAGSANSAVRINPVRLAELVGAAWVDVCEGMGAS
ncbi:MAG: YbaK/EbsC family protein [Bradyrhizobiaceae bacterium]|nr:YbaK/EbsC family protein [Hyphomicrobiales bacterium]MBV9428714.1 YbaK/EbsC family protein [Bradyrhizobiaceae bacterium]